MAEGTLIEPAYVTRLSEALGRALAGAHVTHEQVRRDRYRFLVIWDKFDDMGHPERQRMVWDLAESVLDKSDLLRVAMIITLGQKELPENQATGAE